MKERLKFRGQLAICVAVLSCAFSATAQEQSPPKVDHILLEVPDLKSRLLSTMTSSVCRSNPKITVLRSCSQATWAYFFPAVIGIGMKNAPPTLVQVGACIRTWQLLMLQQRSSGRAKLVTGLRKSRENTVGERRPLSLTRTATFGHSLPRRNRGV